MNRAVLFVDDDGWPLFYSPDAEISLLNHSADGEVLSYSVTDNE